MSSIKEKQDAILKDFADIGDPFDAYAYLIELSALLPPMDDSLKTEDRAVAGCQSTVWLDMSTDADGTFSFQADSNTFIMKGILYLLQQVLCGEKARDVSEADICFLKSADITGTFESARHKGISYIIRDIKEFAAAHA